MSGPNVGTRWSALCIAKPRGACAVLAGDLRGHGRSPTSSVADRSTSPLLYGVLNAAGSGTAAWVVTRGFRDPPASSSRWRTSSAWSLAVLARSRCRRHGLGAIGCRYC